MNYFLVTMVGGWRCVVSSCFGVTELEIAYVEEIVLIDEERAKAFEAETEIIEM